MNIDIVVNDRNEVVLFHDSSFGEPVAWGEFEAESRDLTLVFEDQGVRRMAVPVEPQVAKRLRGATAFLVVRVEHDRMIEGYDCSLIVQDYDLPTGPADYARRAVGGEF